MNRDDLLYQADVADLVQQLLLIADIRASGVEPEPQELATLKDCLDRVGRRATRYHLGKLIRAAVPIALAEADQQEAEDTEVEAYVTIREQVMSK